MIIRNRSGCGMTSPETGFCARKLEFCSPVQVYVCKFETIAHDDDYYDDDLSHPSSDDYYSIVQARVQNDIGSTLF